LLLRYSHPLPHEDKYIADTQRGSNKKGGRQEKEKARKHLKYPKGGGGKKLNQRGDCGFQKNRTKGKKLPPLKRKGGEPPRTPMKRKEKKK